MNASDFTHDFSFTDVDGKPLHFALTAFTPRAKRWMASKYGAGAVEAIIPIGNRDQVVNVLRCSELTVDDRISPTREIVAEMSMCEQFSVGSRDFLSLPQAISVPVDSLKAVNDSDGELDFWEHSEYSNQHGHHLHFVIFND